ncbi:MAG: 50S ribosomal protein L24 [Tenacibaculum sp.]
MKKIKIKYGDTVKVIAGEDKGVESEVLRIFKATNKAVVKGVNMVYKHVKPDASNPKGGIVEKEAPIHISNLALVENGKAVRVSYRFEDGKKVRFSKKSDKEI